MRIALLLSIAALAAAGCGDDNTGGDQGAPQDLSGASDMPAPRDLRGADLTGADLSMSMMPDLRGADLAGADLTMSMMPDLSRSGDGGGVGAMCMTACDCQPGLRCDGTMHCRLSTMFPVYCCTSTTCPAGAVCQNPTGGFNVCGGGDGGIINRDGGVDGGVRCQLINCNNDNQCRNAGCGTCDQNNNICMP
jgi:hypothetical protein